MMGFVSFIIIWIVVIMIIRDMKASNRRREREQNSRGAYGSAPMPDYRGYRETTGNYQGQQKSAPAQPPKSFQKKGNTPTTGTSYGKPSPGVADGRKEQSTTDYLNEKAKQDQREHVIEKMQEMKRVDQKYGNRPVGGRYLPGDPIPSGMKIVCCEYCGAENVVKIGYRGDRNCYFCRSRLEE